MSNLIAKITNIGRIKDKRIKKITNSVKESSATDVRFKVKGSDILYCDIYAYSKDGGRFGDFGDDVSLEIIRTDNKTNSEELVIESDLRGAFSESAFAILPKGQYIARISHKQNLDGKNNSTKFKLEFDAKTFKQTSVVPNDPLFGSQWHLLNIGQSGGLQGSDINAVQAWKYRTDASDIVIAVIDGGVDIDHPDLDDNLWINKAEIPDNGIDDDQNGYVDDINGWNFVKRSSKLHKDKHGTHVAGIIGAEGDNKIGVSGVAWKTQIMSLDVFDDGKFYTDENLLEAINYAVDNGADVINMSLGYTIDQASLQLYKEYRPDIYQTYIDIFSRATKNGVTIVAAAGNDDAKDSNSLSIPSAFSSEIDGFISVAAVDHSASITDYSNYGGKITIAAPGGSSVTDGSKVFSTFPVEDQSYGAFPGTSMAAPVVSGTIALLLAENKKLTPQNIEVLLDHTASKQIFLQGYVQSGNLIDVENALLNAKNFDPSQLDDDSVDAINLDDNLSVPYNEISYPAIAKRLWKKSGKDRSITYTFTNKKVSADSAKLLPCHKTFITQALEEIEENTSLTFQKINKKKADFIIGAQSEDSSELSLSETKRGISFAWPFGNSTECLEPLNAYEKSSVIQDLGWTLGLQTLDKKSQFIYTFSDTAMAWDWNVENDFKGFTTTDYAVINHVWDTF